MNKKIATAAGVAVLAGMFASAGYCDTTYFLGKDGGAGWYTKFGNYKWSNGDPYDDNYQNMDVVMDTSHDGFLGSGPILTWAEKNGSSNSVRTFNSWTIKGDAIKYASSFADKNPENGLAIGAGWASDKLDEDRYSTLKVTKDFTVDDTSTNIVGGGIHKGDAGSKFEGKYGISHSYFEVGGNFNYGMNDTLGNTNGQTFRFGGLGGYLDLGTETAYAAKYAPLDKVTIGGDVKVASAYNVSFNVGTKAYGDSYDLSASDVEIKGRVIGYGGEDKAGNVYKNGPQLWNKYQSYLRLMSIESGNNTSTGRTSVISVNGISGYFVIGNDAASKGTSSGGKYLSILNLTNDADTSVSSAYLADEVDVSFNSNSQVKVVMSGAGEQRFYEAFNISGGIEVNNGALLIKSTIQGTNGHTYRYDKDNPTSEPEAKSHGDLVMNGGIFGFYLADSLNKNFRGGFTLTNLEYNGGKIRLCAYGDYVDSLDVSGTITAADAIVFDFVAKGDDFSYLTSGARKIISWASAPSDATYDANEITVGGTSYKAEFTELADGLYVQYTPSIPEPATCALLFGGFALAFAAWRKKRQ